MFYKKYVVEGRWFGIRLILDVLIELLFEKFFGEIIKKLEKFCRFFVLSGGIGMGYMFFR